MAQGWPGPQPVLGTREKLDAAMAWMGDAVFITDLEGNFVECNDAFATYHRFANRQACFKNLAEYQACLEVFLPNGEAAPRDQWAVPRALRGETATGAEFTLRRRDTGATWVGSYSFGPIRDAQGHILGAVVTGRDITDLKQRERAIRKISTAMKRTLIEKRKALGRAERLAEQLRSLAMELGQTEQRERLRLAHVLHDHLQQLLVGATFAVETLSTHIQGEAGLKTLDEVTETIQQAIHLSRVLTVELSPPAILEKGLAASLEWLGRNVKDHHGLNVALTLEGDPEPVPEPVRLFIFEAVREILLNVVKHAKVDTACVRMRALEGERIEVTIEDRGVGFDPATLEADQFTGEGLGLFSLRERLRFLKGSMTIHSRPGHGSRFILVVPIQGWPTKRK